MDSSSSWYSDAFPPLDPLQEPSRSICCPTGDDLLEQFCAASTSDIEHETLTLAHSRDSTSIQASLPIISSASFLQDSDLGDCRTPDISNNGLLSPASDKLKDDYHESNSSVISSESESSFKTGLTKRLKTDQSASQPKAQISQSQVRKLGEKITALQQLVSPFGKTDTASVLSEAIGYIKFLQDQVHVLSSPYMASNGNRKGCESQPDLRSRGLCLVPISCTANVANNNGADYWISGISGCSR